MDNRFRHITNNRSLITLLAAIILPIIAKLIAYKFNKPFGIDMIACTVALVFLVGMFVFPHNKKYDPFAEAEKIDRKRKEELEKKKKNVID